MANFPVRTCHVSDPMEIEQLSASVRRAVETRSPLCIRGGGSKNFYGQRLQGDVLDVSGYRGIVDYEPTELVITARAGTLISEAEAALAAAGQVLAFEPPRFNGGGTIGGAVAAGLSGPRRPYAGAVRDFILGVRIIDGHGDDLSFGGQVIKNVAGFDVSRLMAGAMGTLGVLTEVSLKTLPGPPAATTLLWQMGEADAIRRMNEWAGKPVSLSGTCYRDGVLAIRLSGAESALAAARARMGGDEMADANNFWDGLRDQTDAFYSAPVLWRVSLPPTTSPLALDVPQVIEWGGALRWLAANVGAVALRYKVTALGGHATLFRAADKAAGVFQPLAPGMAAVHRRLKTVLDPQGIFNPGRMYDFNL